MNEWVITKGEAAGHRAPAKKASSSRRVGSGAVKKARELRQRQLDGDLAKRRHERLAKAVGGEFGVRATDGSRVERLKNTKPTTAVAPREAVVCDPPLRRMSKQLGVDEQPGDRVEYASDVVLGDVIVNGKRRARKDAPGGGNFPGADVRKLLP